MGGSKSSLGFLVLLLIVLFSGTSSGEFGDKPAGEREEVGWGKGDGGGVRGASRNFLQRVAAAPSSFLSLGPFAPRRLLPASCRLSGPEQGCLGCSSNAGSLGGDAGRRGGRDAAGNAVETPKGLDCPWEVGALEQGRLGPVGLPGEKGPRPTPKSTPSRPDLCNRDPSGPFISRPLKDQPSFPAVSYKRRADSGAQAAAAARSRVKRA